jgi:hypothetical protein
VSLGILEPDGRFSFLRNGGGEEEQHPAEERHKA